jgi:fatty-acyl-CoA synthase
LGRFIFDRAREKNPAACIPENRARHKISKYVEFMGEISMNTAGKILKYKMRNAAIEKLGL